MPWIYNEDGALKLLLQGITVQDANASVSGRPVPVRYRLPEDELSTLSYPIIIIEHNGILPDPTRETRTAYPGFFQFPYAPEGYAPWWAPNAVHIDPLASPYYTTDWPIPYNIDYTVTVYCRKMVEHLQPIVATLATNAYLPYKFGYLPIPQDNTLRSMFVIGGPEIEYGKDGDNKRLLRATYKVRVLTETHETPFTPGLVNTQFINLGVYSDVTDITTEELAANQAVISTGPNVVFNVSKTPQGPGTKQPIQTTRVPRKKPSRAVVK
jgi:hypothetical protein